MPQSHNDPRREKTAGFTTVTPVRSTIEDFQPIRIGRLPKKKSPRKGKPRRFLWVAAGVFLFIILYFFAPLRTNLMVLGIDRAPDGTALGRSDTIILMTVVPTVPYVGMMSIPRDLWVPIEDVGENRINTVHFFAERNQPGSGPAALKKNIKDNFGVDMPYFVRVKFDGLVGLVDAMGGVDVTLAQPTALYEAGTHHLDGEQALAFVRDRKGADDFSRMARSQLFIESLVVQAIRPASWPRMPSILWAGLRVVDTNVPIWQVPRLGFAFLRTVIFGIDAVTFDREMATPFATNEGASVLLPNWDLIRPAVREMFGWW